MIIADGGGKSDFFGVQSGHQLAQHGVVDPVFVPEPYERRALARDEGQSQGPVLLLLAQGRMFLVAVGACADEGEVVLVLQA